MRHSLTWAYAWLAGGLAIVGVVLVLLLMPAADIPSVSFIGDKPQHLLAFAGMTGWFCGVLRRRYWWLLATVMVALGFATEYAQGLMSVGRAADPLDLGADILGIVLALALAALGLDRWCAWAEQLLGQKA